MGSLECVGVSFAHANGRVLLSDVSFRLARGVTALIGENGTGKSTLLCLLRGELRPDAGFVRCAQGVRMASVEDTLAQRSPAVAAFAESSESDAHRLRAQLALCGLEQTAWSALSPGQRRRFQLGAALFVEPDVLLLDEPSNHIDEAARRYLIQAVKDFRGDTLVVSHDRALIDALAVRTLHLKSGTLQLYEGGYSAARTAIDREQAGREHEKGQRVREAKRERRLLDDARRQQAAADRARSTRTRLKSARDSDGRSMGRSVAAGWAEARAGRTVRVQRNSAERAALEAQALHVAKELGRTLHAAFTACPRPHVLTLQTARLGYPGRVLMHDVTLTVGRTLRACIEGPNGAGKSTLLAALLQAAHDPERVLYLPQEIAPALLHARLAALQALERDERGRVLAVLAALGVAPERVLHGGALSAGETRKLWLAWGLGRGAHALLLDEPTNNLDLPSVERLEAALSAYPGALLVISHDARFVAAARLAQRWRIEDSRVRVTSY